MDIDPSYWADLMGSTGDNAKTRTPWTANANKLPPKRFARSHLFPQASRPTIAIAVKYVLNRFHLFWTDESTWEKYSCGSALPCTTICLRFSREIANVSRKNRRNPFNVDLPAFFRPCDKKPVRAHQLRAGRRRAQIGCHANFYVKMNAHVMVEPLFILDSVDRCDK